jgi:hypothetical protein
MGRFKDAINKVLDALGMQDIDLLICNNFGHDWSGTRCRRCGHHDAIPFIDERFSHILSGGETGQADCVGEASKEPEQTPKPTTAVERTLLEREAEASRRLDGETQYEGKPKPKEENVTE